MATQKDLLNAASETRSRWIAAAFNRDCPPPLSFNYDGKPSAELLPAWTRRGDVKPVPHPAGSAPLPAHTEHTVSFFDPHTGLSVFCVITEFHNFPAVEWVTYFKNTGGSDTPIIADIQPLDFSFPAAKDHTCRLHHAKGSDCKFDDFQPLETPLATPAETRIESHGGRSSNITLPFFNLEMAGSGVIGAIGWTGDWAATFIRAADGPLRVRAGMKQTRLRLRPGEEIRSPRIMLLFWENDRLLAHNTLRRFLLEHHRPQINGRPAAAPLCHAVWGENTAAQQITKARWWKDNNIPLEYFWIDAGWHGDGKFREDSTVFNSDWWKHVGNWWPNKTTYPDGLRPVGDALKELGFGFVLWLEPERVFKDTFFTKKQPNWLLGPIGDNWLFDLGNPEARRALTELVSRVISDGRVTCYRQDFNTEPQPFWKAADAPDRIGMHEIRHIEGLYAFWDDLLARHPGLLIDNCSSGGRRIDLETISRSIPLWRSDFQCWPNFNADAMQCQTHGLARWVPLSTGCVDRPDAYAFRSAFGPGVVNTMMIFNRDPDPSIPIDLLRRLTAEQLELCKYFYGDFYPLTKYSVDDDVWMAWQFDRPDLAEGLVQVFRRASSPYETARLKLHGLEPDATYDLADADTKAVRSLPGADLMNAGLEVAMKKQLDAAVFVYRKK